MLEEVMLNLDKDGSGTLDWDEFKIVALKVAQDLSLSESEKHQRSCAHYHLYELIWKGQILSRNHEN